MQFFIKLGSPEQANIVLAMGRAEQLRVIYAKQCLSSCTRRLSASG